MQKSQEFRSALEVRLANAAEVLAKKSDEHETFCSFLCGAVRNIPESTVSREQMSAINYSFEVLSTERIEPHTYIGAAARLISAGLMPNNYEWLRPETHNSPAVVERDLTRFPCDFPGKQ